MLMYDASTTLEIFHPSLPQKYEGYTFATKSERKALFFSFFSFLFFVYF